MTSNQAATESSLECFPGEARRLHGLPSWREVSLSFFPAPGVRLLAGTAVATGQIERHLQPAVGRRHSR